MKLRKRLTNLWNWISRYGGIQQPSPWIKDSGWEGQSQWERMLRHDRTLPLTKDERDIYDNQLKTMELERDEWVMRYHHVNKKYQAALWVLDRYANRRNWTSLAGETIRRVWVSDRNGYDHALAWRKEHLEKEVL